MTCLSGLSGFFFSFASALCLLSSSSSGSSEQATTAGSWLAVALSLTYLLGTYLPTRSHFSCLGSSSQLPHIPYSVSLFPWSPCPSVRLQPPSPCTTGLNHQISPFLTASNSVHPPIRRPVDVPSLPNHKPSIIQSNPIGAPRWHSLTNLSHPHTRLKQTHYSLTHPSHSPTHLTQLHHQWFRNSFACPSPLLSCLPDLCLCICLPPAARLGSTFQQRLSTHARQPADHGRWHLALILKLTSHSYTLLPATRVLDTRVCTAPTKTSPDQPTPVRSGPVSPSTRQYSTPVSICLQQPYQSLYDRWLIDFGIPRRSLPQRSHTRSRTSPSPRSQVYHYAPYRSPDCSLLAPSHLLPSSQRYPALCFCCAIYPQQRLTLPPGTV